MGEVILFPSKTSANEAPDLPESSVVVDIGGSYDYHDLEEIVRQQMYDLTQDGQPNHDIYSGLETLNEYIAQLNNYPGGVPEGIMLNMHNFLARVDAELDVIKDFPLIVACLVETIQQPDSHDPEQQQRALAAAALLPLDGTRLYGLRHYQTPDTTPPSIA